MTADPAKPYLELSIEFVIELLLFLYPYGADQMGLPHSFWLGLGCWFAATLIAIRMFWIFPAWARRLSVLEKSLFVFIGVGIFVLVFYAPVIEAFRKRNAKTETAESTGTHTRSPSSPAIPPADLDNDGKSPPVPTTKPIPPAHATKRQLPGLVSNLPQSASSKPPLGQDNCVHLDKGSTIEQQTSGPCSPTNVGGSATFNLNCGPMPPRPPHVTCSQEQLEPGKEMYVGMQMGLTTEAIQHREAFFKKPGLVLKCSVDDEWPNPGFLAVCNRPCEPMNAVTEEGMSQSASAIGSDLVVATQFLTPTVLFAGGKFQWEIRSKDDNPIAVVDVTAVHVHAQPKTAN